MTDLPAHPVTRDELYTLLRTHGIPIGRSTLDKLCMPSRGEGPPVAAFWPGRGKNPYRPLYDAQVALNWARGLFKAPIPNL